MSTLTKVLERNIKVIEKNADLTEGRFRLGHHLMPPVGWLNDPNGLCWYKGRYHVFFQYAPFDVEGGLKFWGHYTSEDLVDWKYEGTALYPDSPYDCHGVYSGSALAESEKLHLFFTGNVKIDGDYDYINEGRETSTLHVESEDGIHFGDKEEIISFEKYPEEFTCHIRDPKVWKENDKYFMVLGGRLKGDKGAVLVYESENLKEWKFKHIITTPEAFGYMWECPDLFELDGQWFLCCSPQGVPHEKKRFQNTCSCGFFPLSGDFRSGCTLGAFIELDCGFDFYAPQSFLDGARRIQFGWMGMPDAPCGNPATVACGWQHCLTVPCELTQRGGRLRRYPVKELEQLREKPVSPENAHIFDMELRIFCPGRLVIRGAAVVEWSDDEVILSLGSLSGAGRTIRYARTQAQTMRILADASSLEIFINHGETVLTTRYYPDPAARGVVLDGGTAQLWSINRMEIMDGISR